MRSTKAEINLDNLKHNFLEVKKFLGGSRKICVAIKADGYGHGAVPCARTLSKAGADMFGLATADEARELRAAGINTPLLLLGLVSQVEMKELIAGKTALVVGDEAYLRDIWDAAASLNLPAAVHLKVDVGMGRLGCSPAQVLDLAYKITRSPWSSLEGFCTHFPSADNGNPEPTGSHLRVFAALVKDLETAGLRPPLVHAANSAALLEFPESHWDMVRPGILVYGYLPDEALMPGLDLKPVMTLETRISFIKETEAGTPLSYGSLYHTSERGRVATLPLGYADGYFRAWSNLAPVKIGGRIFQVSGRVCMDQILVDLGSETDIHPGDRAVLFGAEGPTAWDLAKTIGTIPYEVTCAVSKRVPRVYAENQS